MSNLQKIKSLLLLLCFIVSAFIYYSTTNEKVEVKENKSPISKAKSKKNELESQQKSSVSTVYYE